MLLAEPLRHKGREFDPEFGAVTVKIMAGECFASAEELAITTLLGSCVSVCLFDVERRVGGMNHFVLPELQQGGMAVPCSGTCAANCCRYGACAMKQLLLKLEELGAHRARLAAKLFGAGQVLTMSADIGGQNAAFAIDYLKQQQIPIVASDLGDCCPRKVVFFPTTGRAWVKRLREIPQEERTCR